LTGSAARLLTQFFPLFLPGTALGTSYGAVTFLVTIGLGMLVAGIIGTMLTAILATYDLSF